MNRFYMYHGHRHRTTLGGCLLPSGPWAMLPLTNVTTQVEQSANTLTQQRLFARLMSFFALLVTLLSAIGLYGVMAYSVAQRTVEIGIRMALGAKTPDVLRLVVWQGLKLVLVGLTAGTFAAVSLKRIVEGRLFGVKAT